MERAGRLRRQRARRPRRSAQLAARADSLAAALEQLGQGGRRAATPGRGSRRSAQQARQGRPSRCSRRRGSAQQGQRRRPGSRASEAAQLARAAGRPAAAANGSRCSRSGADEVVAAHRPGAGRDQPAGRAPARRAGALRAAASRAPRSRAEQGAIEEGVQRLLEQVRQAAGKNALVPPQIGAALGGAQLQMQRTREAISSATPNAGRRRSRPAARWTRSTPRPISCSGPGATSPARSRAPGWPRRWSGWRSWRSSRAGWASRAPACCRWRAAAPSRSSSGSSAPGSGRWPRSWRSCEGQGNMPGRRRWRTRRKDLPGGSKRGRLDRQIGRAPGAAVPPDARRRPHAAGPGGGRAEGAAEHHRHRRQRPPAAGLARPACRTTTSGCGCRPGRSCSSSRRRSGGWWWITSAGCPSRP